MISEMLFSGERLGAVGAPMGGFARVLAHVVRQMLLAGERLGAKRTLVGRLACVLPDVIHCWMEKVLVMTYEIDLQIPKYL